MWISKGSFLVLERDSFAGGEAKIKRVYLAKLGTTADVTFLESLASAKGSFQTMAKKLVLDLLDPKLGLAGDNFPPKWEGMAWGERGPGGRFLWLVSDNDFDHQRSTWILAIQTSLP